MISCRKHATNDDILLTVTQHSNQTAVLAFTDINMCNRWIYVTASGLKRYNMVLVLRIASRSSLKRSMAPPKSHKSCSSRLQMRAAKWNTTEQLQVVSIGFKPYSYRILKANMRKPLWTLNTVKTQPVSAPCRSLSDSKLFMAMLLPNRRLGQSFQAFDWHSIGRKPSCIDLVSPSASNVL